MRKLLTPWLLVLAAVACNERDGAVSPQVDNLGTADSPLMSMGEPAFSSAVLQDNAKTTPPPHTLSDADRESIEKLAGTAGAAEEDESEADVKPAKKGSASKLVGSLKKLLGGDDKEAEDGAEESDKAESDEAEDEGEESEGKSEGEEKEEDESPQAIDPAKVLRTEARDEVTAVPQNSGNRPNQGIARARELALEDSRQKLIALVVALPIDPSMTVGRAIGTTQGVKDTQINGMKVVGMKWIDADTLEIEVDTALSDVGKSLQDKFPDSDLKPLIAMGEGKFVSVKGRGVIPANLRNANRSLPGERARQAAEEGGAGI